MPALHTIKGTDVYTSAQSLIIQKNIHDPILSHREGTLMAESGLKLSHDKRGGSEVVQIDFTAASMKAS